MELSGHTRYIGDWSSDVCSSDLLTADRKRVRSIGVGGRRIDRIDGQLGPNGEIELFRCACLGVRRLNGNGDAGPCCWGAGNDTARRIKHQTARQLARSDCPANRGSCALLLESETKGNRLDALNVGARW